MMIKRTEERLGLKPEQLTADTEIRIPFERAFRSRERALREGLEIDRMVFDALVVLRAHFKISHRSALLLRGHR
jgi:LDH2 family malate/lactate/ureidoglycolate dehydrogenase